MFYSFKEYFTIYKEHLSNLEKWKLMNRLVSIYQICDAIIVTGDAVTLNIENDKYILIYRILVSKYIIEGLNSNCCFISFTLAQINESEEWIS